jgi:hypothetical protein
LAKVIFQNPDVGFVPQNAGDVIDAEPLPLLCSVCECDLQGSTIVIQWNIEHPFYQRFILDQRSDGRLVTAVDYLIYSIASAELTTLSEESHEVLNSYKAIVSSNVRTLLA